MTTNNPPSPKMFPGILPFFSISLVFLVSVLILTSPSSSRSQPPVNGGKSVGMPLVRGYVAAAVSQDKPNPDGPPAPGSSRDVFLPGVTVFLHDLVTNTDTSSVRTDLSGRFTLRAPHAGRYTLCWKAEGFESGICSDVVAVGSNPVHVGTIRIKPDRRGGTTAVFGSVRMKDGTRGRTLEPMFNVNSFARVGLYDASNNLMQEVYVNNFGEYLMPQVPARQHLVLRARIEGVLQNSAFSRRRILRERCFNLSISSLAIPRPAWSQSCRPTLRAVVFEPRNPGTRLSLRRGLPIPMATHCDIGGRSQTAAVW